MPKKADNTVKIIKKIPASESGPGVHCITTSNQEYYITQCLEKKRFTLWQKIEDGFKKISTSKSPLSLYDIIPWDK